MIGSQLTEWLREGLEKAAPELGIDGGVSGSAMAGPNLGSITFAPATPGTAPEPGTVALLLSSLLAVVLLRHRRVAHASSRAEVRDVAH